MRVVFLGDTHGNAHYIAQFYEFAQQLDIHAVVQVGDFGFWENGRNNSGSHFLDSVSKIASEYQVPFFWIDGNHENFDTLYEHYVKDDWDNFIEIRRNLFYIPRGMTWTWGGVKFLGMGGAYSIDKRHRSPHISWWPQEMITDEEVDRAIAKGKVDIVISHDTPAKADIAFWMRNLIPVSDSEKNRKQLDKVVDAVKPSLLIHGHYHWPLRYHASYDWGDVKIIGLDADVSSSSWSDSCVVIDTSEENWRI